MVGREGLLQRALLARQPAQLDLAGGDVPRLLSSSARRAASSAARSSNRGHRRRPPGRDSTRAPALRSAPTPGELGLQGGDPLVGPRPRHRARVALAASSSSRRASASSARRRSVASSSSRRATSGEAPDDRAARSSSSRSARVRASAAAASSSATCAPNSALLARHSARSRSSDTMRVGSTRRSTSARSSATRSRQRVALVLQRVGQLRPRRELGDAQRLLLQLRLGLRQGTAGVVALLAGDVALALQRVPLGLQRRAALARLGGDGAQLVQLGRRGASPRPSRPRPRRGPW